jgi:hypothetical protein
MRAAECWRNAGQGGMHLIVLTFEMCDGLIAWKINLTMLSVDSTNLIRCPRDEKKDGEQSFLIIESGRWEDGNGGSISNFFISDCTMITDSRKEFLRSFHMQRKCHDL